MTNSITTFDTVKIITALTTMTNELQPKQEILLDYGTLEMFSNERGYSIYYTTFEDDCKYVTDANTYVMEGDIARTYDSIIEVINE